MASPHNRAATISLRVLTSAQATAPPRRYSVAVGLKRLVRGWSASLDDLEHDRLSSRFKAVEPDRVELCDCPLRCKVRVAGEIISLRTVPRSGSPSLEATVDDGTGKALVVFTGRRAIRGLDPGRGVVLEGVARRERDKLTLVNPAYTLLP